MGDQEKNLIEAAQLFANQFGDDSEYSRMLMEIVLEELMQANTKNYKADVEGQSGKDLQ